MYAYAVWAQRKYRSVGESALPARVLVRGTSWPKNHANEYFRQWRKNRNKMKSVKFHPKRCRWQITETHIYTQNGRVRIATSIYLNWLRFWIFKNVGVCALARDLFLFPLDSGGGDGGCCSFDWSRCYCCYREGFWVKFAFRFFYV